ncbi:hypothetical protein TCDM_04454 [Trypanosoma cruzi Dm28c]|uniref:CRAL-TRIO domain-containing protein n=1 Tax=Trypanosoma cruzi Dm28c TaxID=1416333 RepID=V5BQT0_TRYCR|nr:hypothetical protein TCDM_04454 [Trypanosoma cruzi Dm28c]
MDSNLQSGGAKARRKTETNGDMDVLVAEVLHRIGLQASDGVVSASSMHEKRCEGENDVSVVTGSTGEVAELSFSGFPQFEHCCSAEFRCILTYRYLKANNFDVEDTVAMIVDTNKFRKQHRLDSIMIFPSLIPLRGFSENEICDTLHLPMAMENPMGLGSHDNTSLRDSQMEYLNNHHILRPIVKLITRHYANSIHYWDKDGHPVSYGRLQHIKIHELYRELRRISPLRQRPEDLILLFHLYGNELLWRVVQYCSVRNKVSGTEQEIRWKETMTTVTVVVDCKGARLLDYIWGPFPRILREIINLDQKYYPEILHKLVLANCPKSVAFAHWFSKQLGAGKQSLRRKILCVSEENTPSLLKLLIDEDKLPAFLGGTCRCEEGCVPLNGSTSNGTMCYFFDSNNLARVAHPSGSMLSMEDLPLEQHEGEAGSLSFLVQKETENFVVRARRKLTLTYEVGVPEEITWEFAVKHGEIGFTAVFVACSADGHTEILMPPSTVKEAADHFVFGTRGELILTWDNTRSLITVRKIQLRVHRRVQRLAPQRGASVATVTERE